MDEYMQKSNYDIQYHTGEYKFKQNWVNGAI